MSNKRIRIFHIESPGPLDALDGRSEAPVLCAITPLMNHKIYSQTIYSRADFVNLCKFLGTIGEYEDPSPQSPLVLHISAHGTLGGAGIQLGSDSVDWQELTMLLQPFIRVRASYEGPHILVLSACKAHRQKMTRIMGPKAEGTDVFVPPQYIFCTEDVLWEDAAVAWTLFYHLLPKANLDQPDTVKELLKKIADVGVQLHYFRWDEQENKYKHFPRES